MLQCLLDLLLAELATALVKQLVVCWSRTRMIAAVRACYLDSQQRVSRQLAAEVDIHVACQKRKIAAVLWCWLGLVVVVA